ncbi:hypothetical protein CCMSSC00406_0008530 [Pleurotus cornucopiae]|uniref:Uncharacterized protein n=1 Tax=Pleurotus cornucopiae TaxID=5321 RepID=A0ACB7IZE8_PLECO|nr:hypothetical protein CCMSSC00406_0008530 [Pleurotus cornucopiae]
MSTERTQRREAGPEEQKDSLLVARSAQDYENHLTPPAGTVFFSKETITVFDNVDITNTNIFGDIRRVETLTWRPEVYKYVTNARPDDPKFQQHGGEVYIILVHGGIARAGVFSSAIGYEYMQTIKVPSSVIPVKQFPASGSGTQSGDNWSYKIGFKQSMSLFNNGGNSAIDFDASYVEDFVRIKSQQRGSETDNGVYFSVSLDEDVYGEWPVIGLSVFKCMDTNFPVTFTFEASTGQRRNDVYTPDDSISRRGH